MIYIHKNDSTVFADQEKFLTFHIKTNYDLTGWKAEFCLCSVKKNIDDISAKTFEVILSAKDTSKLWIGKPYGELRLIDAKGNIKTIANNIPFCVTKDIVENEAQTIDLDIPESAEISVCVSYQSAAGTSNYEHLENKPSINGVELKGDKSLDELGIQPKGDYLTEHQDVSHLATKEELSDGLETKQPKGDYVTEDELAGKGYITKDEVEIPDVDLSNYATKAELDTKANDGDVVHKDGTEVINGAKTFNSAVNFIGSGDSNSVGISENTRFNVHNTNKTILGMGNGLFYINHGDYRLRLRGKDARPHYNSDSNYLALLSDIPNTSNLATKTEVMQMIASIPQFALKVVTELPTTGEKMTLYLVPKEGTNNDVYDEYIWIEETASFEHLGTTAVDLTDYAKLTDLSNLATKAETEALLDEKQDVLTPTLPLTIQEKVKSNTVGMSYTSGYSGIYTSTGSSYNISNVSPMFAISGTFNSTWDDNSIKSYIDIPYTFGDVVSHGTYNTYGYGSCVYGKTLPNGVFIPITDLTGSKISISDMVTITDSTTATMEIVTPTRTQANPTKYPTNQPNNVRLIQLKKSGTGYIFSSMVKGSGGSTSYSYVTTVSSNTDRIAEINTVRITPAGTSSDGIGVTSSKPYPVTSIGLYSFNGTLGVDTCDFATLVNKFDLSDVQVNNYLELNHDNTLQVVDGKLSTSTKILVTTQSDYDALTTKEANTLYLIEE